MERPIGGADHNLLHQNKLPAIQLYSCTGLYSCSDPLHETKLYTLDLASLTTTMRAILLLAIAGLVAARRGAKPCEYEKPAQLSTVRAFR